MKRLLETLANVRIAAVEVGGTITVLFIVVYAIYCAWRDFGESLFK